jgi:RHS repeat-associated protein
MGVSKKVTLDKDQKYTIGYSFKNKMGISANNFVLLELIKDGSIMYTRKLQATEANTFDYTAPATGEYTWRMRSSSIGTTTTQPLTYSLDNLSIFYTYPYTVENCDNLADGYRLGFNGKEKDNEVYGEGNLYNFGARIHDARIGRFLSVDPLYKKNAGSSTYSYAANNVISCMDKNGMDSFLAITQPSPGSNVLWVTTVIKVSDQGKDAVMYIHQDKDENITYGEWQDGFNEREAEKMNSNASGYGDGTKTFAQVMNVSRKVNNVFQYERNTNIKMHDKKPGTEYGNVAMHFFDFKLNVLFNTDMATIDINSIQPGKYEDAIKDLNEVSTLLKDGLTDYNSPVAPKVTAKSYTFGNSFFKITGETDSRKSNYKGVGNGLLGYHRAKSVQNAVGISDNNSCIEVINHQGECKDENRSSISINVH